MTTMYLTGALTVACVVLLFLPTPRWMRSVLAIGLFAIQLYVLLVSFEGHARGVMSSEIATGHLTADFERGVQSLRQALMLPRVDVLVASIGLFLLSVQKRNA